VTTNANAGDIDIFVSKVIITTEALIIIISWIAAMTIAISAMLTHFKLSEFALANIARRIKPSKSKALIQVG